MINDYEKLSNDSLIIIQSWYKDKIDELINLLSLYQKKNKEIEDIMNQRIKD